MSVIAAKRDLRTARARRQAIERLSRMLAERVESATQSRTITSNRVERAAAALMEDRERIARAGH